MLGELASAVACASPDPASIAAAFDLAGNDLLPATYPHFAASSGVQNIPSVLLKAVGWVESGWRQFDRSGRPLVAPDFGYGIMQVTSGMAGAYGDVHGHLAASTQDSIASRYAFNIAYGATILVAKWKSTPRIGTGDPLVLEDWYYALWAYNGWGWVNNPSNPRFTRVGTPAQNPSTFPYQERVLYFVQHPPHDTAGNPLWAPTEVTIPAPATIGTTPRAFAPAAIHRQPTPALSAIYSAPTVVTAAPNSTVSTNVKVENTGTLPWPSSGSLAVSFGYHLLSRDGDAFAPLTPFSKGVVTYVQGERTLTRDVQPGQSVTFVVQVRAPAVPGTYKVVWDLQQGSDTWFSLQGVLPRVTVLHARAPALAPPTPTPLPTAQVTRAEDVTVVSDTSFPDGSSVAPGQVFDKGWLLYNRGSGAWGNGWTVRRTKGSKFGSASYPLPATKPCHTLNLVLTLIAPRKGGLYTGIWQVFDATGTAVGDSFTAVIRVAGGPSAGTPTPRPTVTSTPIGTPKPLPTATPVG